MSNAKDIQKFIIILTRTGDNPYTQGISIRPCKIRKILLLTSTNTEH